MNPASFRALNANVPRGLSRPEVNDERLRRPGEGGREQRSEGCGENASDHGGRPLGMLGGRSRILAADPANINRPTGKRPLGPAYPSQPSTAGSGATQHTPDLLD
jgi:hypothetical protein